MLTRVEKSDILYEKGGRFMSYKDVARRLIRNGWHKKRQTGSHVIFEKNGKIVPLTYGRTDIPKGTLANISRITGISF